MKNLIITAILTSVSGLSAFAQTQQAPSFILNQHLTGNQHYKASQFIEMGLAPGSTTGFEYNAQYSGGEFIAEIDPFMVFPPEEGEFGGPNTGDQGVVGSIAGVFDVNEMGAATYSIPIKLPAGIGGNIPLISFNYSSMAGNGIMGIGWNLGAVSAISRSGKSIYHDGLVQGLQYNAFDNLSFNGMRMMPLAANEYTTEVEGFTKITVLKSNEYGPIKFEARTKDGKKLLFGESENSRQKLGNTDIIIGWFLSSVIDLSGNETEYMYEARSGNLLLKELNYGGNNSNNQSHIYKVVFNYTSGRVDTFTSYLNGAAFTTDCLLDNVQIKYMPQNLLLFTYDLIYDESLALYSRLKNVLAIDEINNLQYNPHSLFWGNESANTFTESYFYDDPVTPGEVMIDQFFTDINGDGLTDVVKIEYEIYTSDGYSAKKAINWYYRLRNTNNSFGSKRYFSNSSPSEFFQTLLFGDFNGDGLGDFLDLKYSNVKKDQSIIERVFFSNGNGFNVYNIESVIAPRVNFPEFKIGDFDGNGKHELLVVFRDKDVNDNNVYIININSESPHSELVFWDRMDCGNTNFANSTILVADFNGDGKSNIFRTAQYKGNPNTSNSFIYNVNFMSNNLDWMYDSGYPTNWHQIYPGDFNGDGITDILTYNYTAQNPIWELGIFNGKDSFVINSNVPDLGHFNLFDPIDSYWNLLSLNDFNADGKTDIIKLKKSENGNTADYTIYYSNGNEFSSINSGEIVFYGGFNTYGFANQISYDHIFPFTDFNGDGNLDIYVENGVWGDYIYFHEVDDETKRLTSFINGLGSKTSVAYLPLTNSQVYHRSYKPLFPLTNIQPSFYVVRSIKNDIGEAHLTTETFFYQDLLFHKQGKGLLGFGKRSVTDNFTGISAETISDLYVIQQKFYLPYAKEIKTKKASGEIISLTLNILKHKSYTSSPLRLFPYIESTHTIEKDITTNGFVKTTHADFTYDDFGNMLSTGVLIDPAEKEITAVASDYKHQTTTNYQYYSPDLTNWLVGKPEKITTQTRFLNEIKDGATQVLIYYPAGHSSFPFIKEKQTFPTNILNGNLATSELFTYDDFGNIETITLSAPNSQPQLETRTSSKIFGAEYHHRFPTTSTNALLNTASATYDPVYGTLKTSTGPNELTSQFESNPLGTFSKTIAPDGSTTITVSRWANGNEHAPANALYYTWQQTSGSPEVMVFYHKTGAELRSVTFGFDGNPVYIDKIYNNKGLLHKESLPYKKGTTPLYTEYLYDNYNRLKDVIAPDDTKTTTSYAANEVNVTVVNGNITRTSKKKYNAAGWLEESTDNSGSVVKNEYYCNGNLKKSYIVGQPATAISLEYDARGNRTLLDDPNYGQMVTVYNAYGELITQTNPRNETTSFTYDKLGRMTNESSQTEGNIAWTYSTTPKRIGTLENIIKNNHRTNYVYDDKLRLTSETEIIDGASYSTRYTYDELGRPFRTTYPTGVTLQDGYNNYGYHTTVSLESSGKQLWKTEQVNAMGLVTKYRTGNDLETEQTYYPLTSLPYTVQTVKKGNEPVQDLEYKWDGLGNLEYRKKWLNRGNNTSLTESFTYDGLDRLISGSLNGSFTTLYHTYDIPKLG
ncbi:MAG: SpvB/TcaC N-terminal domain-containing protein, partial [Lentimicrobiaceae bacterium]|nr:SpvB/TcaC N-terminal domain-containing protein [Lentimicrobiaceae bacterium]